MFWVQYTAADVLKRQEDLAKQTAAQASHRNWKPVGAPTETAAISAKSSEPAGR
jgi:hypothetical protein